MHPERQRIPADAVALDQVEAVPGAVAELQWPVFRECGAHLVPHLRRRHIDHAVAALPDAVTQFGVFGIEHQVFLKKPGLLERLAAQEKAATRDEVALAHQAVARMIAPVPPEVAAVAVQGMHAAARVPDHVRPVEEENLGAQDTRFGMALGVVHKHAENVRVESDIVGRAEDVFHPVRQKGQT